MLKLRKILLCNKIYYLFLLLVIIISVLRLSLKNSSNYNENSQEFCGIITKIIYNDYNIKIYLKNKETVIVNYQKNNRLSLNLGDKIYVLGKFKKANKNKAEYLFNYQKYLERKNIFYLIDATYIKKMKSNNNFFYYLKQKLYNNLNNNPYLLTFILGDKTSLKDNVLRSYQENGISHLFAISGMHITMFASIIKKILKKMSFKEENIFKIVSFILFIYLFLLGFSPSILRGVLFYFLFSINDIYYFYIKPINLFIITLGICILINPFYIFDIGFQYSFLISFTLIFYNDELNSSNYFFNLLKVSLLSFIVSIPISIYNFYQINILSIFYNLFFVPLVSIIIFPLSLLTVIIKPLIPLFNLSTYLLENISLMLNKITFSKLVFKRILFIFYIFYLLLIIVFLITKKSKFIKILILMLFIHFNLPLIDKSTYLKMIDVNQGDAILIHSHNKNVLFDTGGASSFSEKKNDGKIFYNILSPTLKSLGIKKLDYLIITHGDKDHLGEAKTLISNIKVKKIIINNNYLNYYEKDLINKNTIIGKNNLSFSLNEMQFIQLNDNLEDENDSSQVYYVKYKNIKIFLTGDATIKSEENILKNYNLEKIDILKVAHHGSKTSTSEELLKKIKPKIALISAGKDNKFNHPHQIIINRLNKYNVKIYCTKELGTITINLDKMKIKSSK